MRGRRWFGLLGLLNYHVIGPLSGKCLAYEVCETCNRHERWTWIKFNRSNWS